MSNGMPTSYDRTSEQRFSTDCITTGPSAASTAPSNALLAAIEHSKTNKRCSSNWNRKGSIASE